jgi:hypothetical protein
MYLGARTMMLSSSALLTIKSHTTTSPCTMHCAKTTATDAACEVGVRVQVRLPRH